MVEVADFRTSIDAQLATISGLRHSPYPPDQVHPPMAYVATVQVNPHRDLSGGARIVANVVLLVAPLANGLARGYEAAAPYLTRSGAKSLYAAIEAGVGLTVNDWDDGPIEYNDVVYVGATFEVEVED